MSQSLPTARVLHDHQVYLQAKSLLHEQSLQLQESEVIHLCYQAAVSDFMKEADFAIMTATKDVCICLRVGPSLP